MTKDHAPHFRDLDRAECDALLARNHVGRLAFAYHNRVDIEPISYVYAEDGFVYGRTAPGTKLLTLAHQPWIAFEVDEIEGHLNWRSVVVHGTVYRVQPEDDASGNAPYTHAVSVLRRLMPAAFTADDPVPARTIVFRIFADDVTGRAADSA